MATIRTDICVIGAGAAGLSVASSAALIGVPLVLIERARPGGDCLYRGCVPSKALIAAAAAAHAGVEAAEFGVRFRPAEIDGEAVMARLTEIIADIEPTDSVERYRALGAQVIEGEARFADARTVEVNGAHITARRFVIATGASPHIPDIPGIGDCPVLTTDTIFAMRTLPQRLAILGAGPVGCELAQAYRRLGVAVTLIEAERLLPNEDAEAAAIVRRQLVADGVIVLEGARIERVQSVSSGMTLDLSGVGIPAMLNTGHLLIATGRAPRTDGLGLEAAGVRATGRGIAVDARQRTSAKHIFAIGDCAEGPHFTHAAAYQAQVVIRNAVFRQRAVVHARHIPRVIYTTPEIATVGLGEADARKDTKGVQTLRFPFSENDRARASGRTSGFVKSVIGNGGDILGVTIVGAEAGELIVPWVMAMQQKLPISAIANLIAPYPTLSEASRRAALQSLTPRLRNPWVGRFIRMARMFG